MSEQSRSVFDQFLGIAEACYDKSLPFEKGKGYRTWCEISLDQEYELKIQLHTKNHYPSKEEFVYKAIFSVINRTDGGEQRIKVVSPTYEPKTHNQMSLDGFNRTYHLELKTTDVEDSSDPFAGPFARDILSIFQAHMKSRQNQKAA